MLTYWLKPRQYKNELHSVKNNSNFEIATLFYHLYSEGKSAAISKLEVVLILSSLQYSVSEDKRTQFVINWQSTGEGLLRATMFKLAETVHLILLCYLGEAIRYAVSAENKMIACKCPLFTGNSEKLKTMHKFFRQMSAVFLCMTWDKLSASAAQFYRNKALIKYTPRPRAIARSKKIRRLFHKTNKANLVAHGQN